MTLSIDSTDNTKTIIKLDDKEFIREVNSPRDQDVFGFLVNCLEKEAVDIGSITEISVNPGPGSFTGTRVGVSIANALGFSLGIKVNGQNNPVQPIYSSPPSITSPKV